jgi:hypothetical protein
MSAEDIKQALDEMAQNAGLNTPTHLSRAIPESTEVQSFQEWHLEYLTGHPKINPQNYLTNLRVMIKVRP